MPGLEFCKLGLELPPNIEETDECAHRACLRIADVTVMHSVVMSATGSTATETVFGRGAIEEWDCGRECMSERPKSSMVEERVRSRWKEVRGRRVVVSSSTFRGEAVEATSLSVLMVKDNLYII